MVGSLAEPFFVHRVLDRMGETHAIVHLANIPNVHHHEPERILRENLSVNSLVACAALERGVPRLVYASSLQAHSSPHDYYGRSVPTRMPEAFPIDEHTADHPENSYGLSKLLSEAMLDRLCGPTFRDPPLSAASLRFPWIMEDDRFRRHAPGWFERSSGPHRLWGFGDGYAYVLASDAARACALAAEAEFDGHELFWIVNPEPRSFHDSIADLIREHGAEVPGAERAIELGTIYDCSKAERILGWTGRTHFADFAAARAAEASA